MAWQRPFQGHHESIVLNSSNQHSFPEALGQSLKSIRIILSLIILLLALPSCTHRQLSVRDLEIFPQQASAYFAENHLILSLERQEKLSAEYLAHFFSPWTGVKNPVEKCKLSERYLGILENGGLGENLLPLSQDFIQELLHNTDLAAYPSENTRGITTHAVHLRVLPTLRPRFLEKFGPEGYPFDLFQESVLWPGTPLILRHVSYDRKWVYVEAGFVAGWMDAYEFVRVEDEQIDTFFQAPKIVLTRDRVPLFSEQNEFIAEGRIGMILPTQNNQVLFPVANAASAKLEIVQVSYGSFSDFPVAMTRSSAAAIIDELKGQPYGWGGLYENRDCSSLLRDYFTIFGIWLPRNSFAQIQSGKMHDLSELGLDAKKKLILEKAIPFVHMVGRKGHVTLYVGTHEGEPTLFHAVWGIPSKGFFGGKSQRIIIGRSAFTGSSPGYENPEARRAGKNLLGIMDFLTDPTWREEKIGR
jgi:SH3 domain (SH3b1 type)/NLPC_P60 stabilising domain, N term/NlpC/P60 family/SH3 domain of SH3b2 type